MKEIHANQMINITGGKSSTNFGWQVVYSYSGDCSLEKNSSTSCTASMTACTPEGTCVTGSLTLNTGQSLACSIVGVGVGAMAAPTGFGSVAGFAASQACNALANSQTGNGLNFSTENKGD